MENLAFGYPVWFVGLCFLAGLVYAALMYFRERQFAEQSSLLRSGLALLRFLSVFFLALLLLAPVLKLTSVDEKKPIILIGQDLSQSISLSSESIDTQALSEGLAGLARRLVDDYEVKTIGFGENIREIDSITYQDKTSNISQFLEYVGDHYGDQNLGAVIMGTDGLYNKGRNPIYSLGNFSAPVYPIALGDTTIKTDQSIKNVYHNQIAYLGDKVTIQADVAARHLDGSQSKLSIERVGSSAGESQRKDIVINSDPFFHTEQFVLDASTPGVIQYRVSLTGIAGETTYSNNTKLISIEVIDGRQNILLLANAPHPDLAAIKASVESHKNYQLEIGIIDNFNGTLKDYDLVILHQVPGKKGNAQNILNFIRTEKIPHMFILGEQSTIPEFNSAQGLVSLEGVQRSANEVQATVNQAFDLFKLEEGLTEKVEKFVPLQAPYGNYSVAPNAKVLFSQRIGKVNTEFPLLIFGEHQGIKTAVLCAEGFWRWRLFDYLQTGNHEGSQTIFQNAIQFLSIKEDKRKFRVSAGKTLYLENEEITLTAELYNQSFELINSPDVFLKIKDDKGKDFDFIFNKRDEAYFINIGKFPVGQYNFSAYTDYNGQRLTASGRFVIQAIQLEQFETTANHSLLFTLANETGGQVIYPSGIDQLESQIRENTSIKPVLYSSVQSRSVIHLKWIAFILAFLLFLEWFLRRYYGGY